MARLVGSLWQDLRFAFRNLNKDRRFTVLAVLALSLGIGSVTVIFSAVYGELSERLAKCAPPLLIKVTGIERWQT